MHAFRTYIFCQSLYTLQRGLPAIAGLLVQEYDVNPKSKFLRKTTSLDVISY